ncbi:putative disease resistance protein At3g14460 isoform X3 [Quercus suber]|uniref:putative disease resistance protein At3g14460 isoform X3 n=1 Tax=Quercus suber TaxID=58331 RepID=UPI0032DFBA55
MAEGALFNVAEGIIGQLGKLALKEIGLLWGVKDELENLKNTVSTIKAVLQAAEEQQAQSHAIKDWVAKLKDVLFEADDLLDDFSTEVLQREVMTRNKKAKEATSLRHLEIRNCPSLTTLPEWICEIISLQSLHISNCPNLTSLPALTSLKTLHIRRCPILVESCKNQDWVARIEKLWLDLAPPKEEDSEQTETNKEYELKTRGFTKTFGRCSGPTSQ